MAFGNGDAQLSGTLWLPGRVDPCPVAVVFHSASDPLRTAPLYRHLVDLLPHLGIGVFLYDRRSSGQSTGPSANGSFECLATDGIAARLALEKIHSVDPTQIGYWGLSQGGWLAAIAANADPKCAFAISVSAPLVKADVQMRFAVSNILRVHGCGETAVDLADVARQAVDS